MNPILKGFEQVPPNFEVLSELCALLRNPYVELGELVRLIEIDPGLASSVVRLSNCAYFGCKTPAATIEEAVQRIGLTEVVKLVGLLGRRVFRAYPLLAYNLSPELAWKEALGAAVLMEYLAYHADVEPGTAYLPGLLHAIGRYPIARLMARIKPNVFCKGRMSSAESARWEREYVGTDYARVGCGLLRLWRFAEEVSEPIGSHLHPFLAPQHRKSACLLNVAVALLPALSDASLDLEELQASIPPGIIRAAGISSETLVSCVEPARAWLKTTDQLLERELLMA